MSPIFMCARLRAEAPRTAPDWSGRNFGGAAERTPVPIKPAEQPRARTEYCGQAPSAPLYIREVPGSNPGAA
jgi:hypothetical protein